MKAQIERELFGIAGFVDKRDRQNDGDIRENVRETLIQDRLVEQIVIGDARQGQNGLHAITIMLMVRIAGATLVIMKTRSVFVIRTAMFASGLRILTTDLKRMQGGATIHMPSRQYIQEGKENRKNPYTV